MQYSKTFNILTIKIMKIFKFMTLALVAMLGFSSCSEDCDHDFIEYDYSNALVGTWTYVDGELAEAMQIKEDGSFAVTGVMAGGSLYEEKGTIKVVNNKVSLVFEGDKDVIEGRLELVASKSLSIVLNEEYDIRLTYDYCEKDLSDKIVGMWVSTDNSSTEENNVLIQTFYENGKSTYTGFAPLDGEIVKNKETNYKVIGNVNFQEINGKYTAWKLSYFQNGTSSGDIMTNTNSEFTETWLRVKQSLNLTGMKYAYSTAYVTNAKGNDEDFSILGSTFNIANIEGSDFDVIFGSDLFCVELNANSIKHIFRIDGQHAEFDAPISVEDNKVTLDFSAVNPAFRTVIMYMFQDANDKQLHMYMPTNSFINYIANLKIRTLLLEGKIDITDTAAVEKIFADMEARIESINVSFVFKAHK